MKRQYAESIKEHIISLSKRFRGFKEAYKEEVDLLKKEREADLILTINKQADRIREYAIKIQDLEKENKELKEK